MVVNPLRESQSNYPDLLPFLTTGAGEKNKAAKKDSKRKKSVAKEKMLLKSYVNIVGKDNTSSIFYSQLQGSESSDIPFTTQVLIIIFYSFRSFSITYFLIYETKKGFIL